MNKKGKGIILAAIIICAVVLGTIFLLNNKNLGNKSQANNKNVSNTNNEKQNSTDKKGDSTNKDATQSSNKKVLVVYFSATNNTKNVARKIAKNLNGDTFEIIPEDEYTSEDLNYSNSNSRVLREHDDKNLRNIKLKTTQVDNWDNYDTILIGYPIWWGVAAWPVNTFVKANDFNGKTVIPFCTSASSGLGESGKLLEEEAKGGNWLEGHRFSSGASSSDIKAWTDSLK